MKLKDATPWKVPFRQVYCDTFGRWLRATIRCHVRHRLFPPRLPRFPGAAALLAILTLSPCLAHATEGGAPDLTAAFLLAVTEGNWWLAVALALGAGVAFLRRTQAWPWTRNPWAVAALAVVAEVLLGAVHHLIAGEPLGWGLVRAAGGIALGALAAFVPAKERPVVGSEVRS